MNIHEMMMAQNEINAAEGRELWMSEEDFAQTVQEELKEAKEREEKEAQ